MLRAQTGDMAVRNRQRGEFARYLGVGGASFLIDFALLLALSGLGVYYLLANAAAFVLASTFNFLAGQRYVFGEHCLDSVYHAYGAVLAISTAGLALNSLVMFAAVDGLDLGLVAAKLLATAVALFWNFGARKKWVYR